MIENQVNNLTCKINNLANNYSFLDKMFLIELLTKPKLLIYSQVIITYCLENPILTKNTLLNTILEEYISFLVENELKINEKKSIYVVNSLKISDNTIQICISFFSNNPSMYGDLLEVITHFENLLSSTFKGNIFTKINEFLTLWSLPTSFFQIDKIIENIIKGKYIISEIKTDIKNINELLCYNICPPSSDIRDQQTKNTPNICKKQEEFNYEPFEPSELETINFDIPTTNQHIRIETTDAETDTYTKSNSRHSINKRIKDLLEITTTDTNEF